MSEYDAMVHNEGGYRENVLRAPFGYPGGKSRSLEYILPHIEHKAVYVEPFGGSGAVLLNKYPSVLEVFNDRNSGVTAFYRALRDQPEELVERCALVQHSREEFLWCRDSWKEVDGLERAARWWCMVVMSFTQQGRNFGRELKGRAATALRVSNNLKIFNAVHDRLRKVTIENQDWMRLFLDYDSEDTMFYFDPPYLECGKEMYEHVMTEDDHILLCEAIFSAKGSCVLSGFINYIYDDYDWDEVIQWTQADNIRGMSDNATNVTSDRKKKSVTEYLFIKT